MIEEIQLAVVGFESCNRPFLLGLDPFEGKWSGDFGPVPTLLDLVEASLSAMDDREQRWIRDRMSRDGSDSIPAIAARAQVSVERVRQILRAAGARTRSVSLWPDLFAAHLDRIALEKFVSAVDLLQQEWAAGLSVHELDGVLDVFAPAPISLRRQADLRYLRTASSADPRIPTNLRNRFLECDPRLTKSEAFACILGYERHRSAHTLASDLVSDWDDTEKMSLKKLSSGSARDWLDAVTTRAGEPVPRAAIRERFLATGMADEHDLNKHFSAVTVLLPGNLVLARRLLPDVKDTSVSDACHAALDSRPATSAKWLAAHLVSRGFPKMAPAIVNHTLEDDARFRKCGRMDWTLKEATASRLSLQSASIERFLDDLGRPATTKEIRTHLNATFPDMEPCQVIARGRVIRTAGPKWGIRGRDIEVDSSAPSWTSLSERAGPHIARMLAERGEVGITLKEAQGAMQAIGVVASRSGAKRLMDRMCVRSQKLPFIRWIARQKV